MAIHGSISWPGVQSVHSLRGTISQGVTPGTFNLITLPQLTPPNESGTLVFTDNNELVTLPGCKVDQLTVEPMDEGFVWSLIIVDRRWKWRNLGGISGAYNQLDPHGKLIPWTIRSPSELAQLCLLAMGELSFAIDMPPGLSQADGIAHGQINPVWIGVQNTTGTNPPINWVGKPPALALADLCEMFGRRVIYRWSTDNVRIQLPGQGDALPTGSMAKVSPSIKAPETPAGVMVVGSPTVYQDRLPLQPVGEEWDGSYRPINQLSYAPIVPGAKQKVTFTVATWIAAAAGAQVANIFITINGVTVSAQDAGGTTPTALATTLQQLLTGNVSPRVQAVTATAASGVVTVEANAVGVPFGFSCGNNFGSTLRITPAIVKVARQPVGSWVGVAIDQFVATATPRLTQLEATRLARKSVYRCFRVAEASFTPPTPMPNLTDDPLAGNVWQPVVTGPNPTGNNGLFIQGYGQLLRRQQIVLRQTQVEQVVPQPSDNQVIDPRSNQPLTLNFYNGYSRDKPAAVYGSIARFIDQIFMVPRADPNTDFQSQVHLDFQIDPEQQLVIFSKPVYYFGTAGQGVMPPELVLQTGFNLRNPITNQLETYNPFRLLPNQTGLTNFAVRVYPDVQLNVFGTYDEDGRPAGAQILELDPIARANYYLNGMAAQYLTFPGLTIQYNGIRAIDMDGAIMQVTWEIDGQGCRTTASRNTEHSIYVPPYAKRRRAEFLEAAQQQAPRGGIWTGSNAYSPVTPSNPYTPVEP